MFKKRQPRPHFYRLTDDIAIGPAPRATTFDALAQEGFAAVVDLDAEGPDNQEDAARHGLDYLRLPVADGQTLSPSELQVTVTWIVERVSSAGPVFVHCREGRSRSATLAVAALIEMGLPVSAANRLLLRARSNAVITPSQAAALEAFSIAHNVRKSA